MNIKTEFLNFLTLKNFDKNVWFIVKIVKIIC